MAAQAVLVAETIGGMKKAIARGGNASDSDDSIHQPTNRGNKLKRKARYVHEGRLDLPSGPRVYSRTIEHAGYKRQIISHNPPRLDEDGDELEDDDEDDEADAAAAEENPYNDIKLEYLLAPLTSAADLPSHPTLSNPYLSEVLREMAQQALETVQRERSLLWDIKELLTKFRGDDTWLPCAVFETENDAQLFGATHIAPIHTSHNNGHVTSKSTDVQEHGIITSNGDSMDIDAAHPESIAGPRETRDEQHTTDNEVEDGNLSANKTAARQISMDQDVSTAIEDSGPTDVTQREKKQDSTNNGSTRKEHDKDLFPGDRAEKADADLRGEAISETNGHDEDEESQPTSHRMTTRAQAQAASDNTTSSGEIGSPSAGSADSTYIHPLFLAPPGARPSRDHGLPSVEADDTRRLLLLYVQKQEEVCRGTDKLYQGLLRANSMKQSLLKWTKAEAHVGEMSDGEDWYDKEEWGLTEDLKKGHEEDEDDGVVQGKKTRNRRA